MPVLEYDEEPEAPVPRETSKLEVMLISLFFCPQNQYSIISKLFEVIFCGVLVESILCRAAKVVLCINSCY